MTLSSLQNGNEVSEKPAEKTKIRPKKNYSQLDNDLFDLSLTGTKDTPAAAFQTLCFILRLHPDTIVTPKNISLQWELRAIKNNGKLKKESTIRHEFRQLCNAGYMTRYFNKDSKGGSMPTQYAINYEKIYNRGVENSTPGFLSQNNIKSLEKNNQKPGVENSTPPPYNKERDLYKENNNSNSRGVRQENTTAPSLDAIELELENQPLIGRDLVEQSLKKFGIEYTLEAIRLSKIKNKSNPGAYFNGAANKRYSSVDAIIHLKKNPSKPTSTMSEDNIQGYRIDFLESLFGTDNFDYFLEMTDEQLKNDETFKAFMSEKGYSL